jgi:multiple sugar transport system substrate-binding protein
MKVGLYHQLVRAGATRRDVLRGAASLAALSVASGTGLGALVGSASAQDSVRAQILQIPGVGKGSPTDAD